jgi:hypothetical protein
MLNAGNIVEFLDLQSYRPSSDPRSPHTRQLQACEHISSEAGSLWATWTDRDNSSCILYHHHPYYAQTRLERAPAATAPGFACTDKPVTSPSPRDRSR